jgi:hypothetical protein
MKSDEGRPSLKRHGDGSEQGPEKLTFTCPQCGCQTLLEHACIWRTIIEVRRPTGPDIGRWDPDPNISHEKDTFWSFDVGDENFYCCEECDAVLEDENGSPGWGGKFLHDWLLAHQTDPKRDSGAD